MFGLQGQELIVILIIVLILFGGKKIPELMRSLGEGMREFRKASSEAVEDLQKAAEEDPEKEKDSTHTTA
ncbi:MAG: twin-arginine translocase TatA/TatE family subunit [Armatimonadetes bacterium]|nr:twin-arginine translocase TatA/TatE family subunit [Armatimonadota bacterium]